LAVLFAYSLSCHVQAQCLTLNTMEQAIGNNLENLGQYLEGKGYKYSQGKSEGSYLISAWVNQNTHSATFAYIGTDEIHQKLIGIVEIEYRFSYKSTCYDEIRTDMRLANFVKDRETISKDGVLMCYYKGSYTGKNNKWPIDIGIIIEMPSEQQIKPSGDGRHYSVRIMQEANYKSFLSKE
jgi:hypothetical protein